jgi:quercetin dioxygenase-like cupin family protein
MIIRKILAQLETATHPVAKALAKGDHQKVTFIAFKRGMELKEHITPFVSTLFVLQGTVAYHEGEKVRLLNKYDETPIPAATAHRVECLEDAMCLLVQDKMQVL